MNTLGLFITQKRELKNLNQVTLAQKAKISKSYLSKIESGHRVPDLDVLERIAVALEIPIEVLIVKRLSKKEPLDVVINLLDSMSKDENIGKEEKKIIKKMIPTIEALNETFLNGDAVVT